MREKQKVDEWLKKAAHDDVYFIAYSQAYDSTVRKAKELAKNPDTFLREMINSLNQEIRRADNIKETMTKTYRDAYTAALSKIRLDLLKHFFYKDEDD